MDRLRISSSRVITSLIAAFTVLLFAACEEIVDPGDAPYSERIVVRCVLSPGDTAPSIEFTRTIPLTDPFFGTNRFLSDVEAVIICEGVPYHARHIERGTYALDGLVPEPGKRYRLEARWKEKRVTASTRVPEVPDILDVTLLDSAHLVRDQLSRKLEVSAIVRGLHDEVYTASIQIADTSGIGLGIDSDTLVKGSDNREGGWLYLKARFGYLTSEQSVEGDTVKVSIFAFDSPYYDFAKSYRDFQVDNGIYETFGNDVRWNVEGDGIGMFIGRAQYVRLFY